MNESNQGYLAARSVRRLEFLMIPVTSNSSIAVISVNQGTVSEMLFTADGLQCTFSEAGYGILQCHHCD